MYVDFRCPNCGKKLTVFVSVNTLCGEPMAEFDKPSESICPDCHAEFVALTTCNVTITVFNEETDRFEDFADRHPADLEDDSHE